MIYFKRHFQDFSFLFFIITSFEMVNYQTMDTMVIFFLLIDYIQYKKNIYFKFYIFSDVSIDFIPNIKCIYSITNMPNYHHNTTVGMTNYQMMYIGTFCIERIQSKIYYLFPFLLYISFVFLCNQH